MNRTEKESRIKAASSLSFPSFQEAMEIAQRTRNDRLQLAEDDDERAAIEREYDAKLDRMVAEISQK